MLPAFLEVLAISSVGTFSCFAAPNDQPESWREEAERNLGYQLDALHDQLIQIGLERDVRAELNRGDIERQVDNALNQGNLERQIGDILNQ